MLELAFPECHGSGTFGSVYGFFDLCKPLRFSQAWCTGATFLYYTPHPIVCQFASPGGGSFWLLYYSPSSVVKCGNAVFVSPGYIPVCEMADGVVGVHLIL